MLMVLDFEGAFGKLSLSFSVSNVQFPLDISNCFDCRSTVAIEALQLLKLAHATLPFH